MSYSTAFDDAVTFSTVNITYNSPNCTQYMGKEKDMEKILAETMDKYGTYGMPNCTNGPDVECELGGHQEIKCRLNVRMQAAFILAACLTIKAIYMIALNVLARKKVKKQCLTFGDVIVASALDPQLQIRNECLVNAGDG